MSFYKEKWWKEAIGYQIYIKSFKDSNNDGIGDLKGITLKLNYLKELGINLIWLTPFYLSPMDDNGYDVSNHLEIDPTFGTVEDFKELIKEAHKRNIKVIIDFVLNHTSDRHEWFINSRKSKDNPYRDFYIWKDSKQSNKDNIEPNNWASFFGGSSWEYDKATNQYYMKIFSSKMPDLNWANQKVRNKMCKVAKYWLNLGIDGFRLDAISHLAKKRNFKDSGLISPDKYKKDWQMFSNLPETFKYLKEMKRKVFNNKDIVTIGEVGGKATTKEALKYSNLNKGSLNMVFNFDHTFNNNSFELKNTYQRYKIYLDKLKYNFNKWQTSQYKKAWQPIYWLNHDHPRLINQYGDISNHYLSATMLATAMYFKWGTPFVYQGEEIGMTNYRFEKIEDFNDVVVKNLYKTTNLDDKTFIYLNNFTTRDNSRTIMSWDDSKYAGFSKVKPWFHINQNYKEINVKVDLTKKDSIFKYYQTIFKLRKDPRYKKTLVYGNYKQLLIEHKSVYAYLRKNDKTILTIVNFFDKEVEVKINGYKIIEKLLSNYEENSFDLNNLKLKKYEALSFLVKKEKR